MELLVFLLISAFFWMFLSYKKQFKKLTDRLRALEERLADSERLKSAEVNLGQSVDDTVTDQDVSDSSVGQASVQPLPTTIHQTQDPKVSKIKATKKAKVVPQWRKNLFSVESIISKLGILLLLIGVGFIFRLAYDNGYITEELAVFMGAVLGGIILFFGYRVHKKERPVLSQVLYGGGIATLYITIYAAYQGYGLIPGLLALMFMCAVTALAFTLAVISNSVAMSVIAILGGLLTPFVLQLEQLGLRGTGIYVLMISVSATIIYVVKRWRLLQLSSIVGAYIVTGYFITINGMTKSDQEGLALLILALLIVFNGTEYVLSILKKSSTKLPMITYGLFISLPVITWLEIQAIISMSELAWSIAFAITCLIYMSLAYLLYRLEAEVMVTNIGLSFGATFATFAAILYFGGDIQVIAVAVLGLMYYWLSKRQDNSYIRLLGHLLIGVAFILGMADLVDITYNQDITFIDAVVRVLVTGLFLVGAWMNKDLEKKVIAGLSLGIYGLIALQLQVYQLAEDWEALAVMVVVHGLFVVLLVLINKKIDLMPKVSFIPLAFLPILLKVGLSAVMVYTDHINGYEIGAFVLYGIGIYLVSQFLMKEDHLYRLFFKTVVYVLAYILLLTDLTIGSESFLYGLFGAGLFLFVLQYLESDREGLWISRLRLGLRSFWFVLLVIYLMVTFMETTFDVMAFIVDLLLILVLWFNLKSYKFKLPMLAKAVMMTCVYSVIIYKNLAMLKAGSGVITLLWAAYAIGLLIFSVVKAHKQLVTFSLILIAGVAAKFVLSDLASVTTIWKIIISMGFGTALLVLSYFLQPILSGIDSDSDA